MTLEEIIKVIDLHLPGNRFDNMAKTMWINEIEGKIFEEIESKTFKPEGNEIRFVKRDGSGKWTFVKDQIYKDPDGTEEEQEEMPGNYADQIDPLNMRRCCMKPARPVYEFVPYKYDEDYNVKLIVPDRFCDVYTHYVLAKIHQADSEIENYNNEVLLFDASYKDYASWSIRNFKRY